MKTQRTSSFKTGFTLMELMVAMAITTIIVTVLVSITSIATDTWNRSRAELRAARQGKAMVDSMARDFEALVVRRGNAFEWLTAESPTSLPGEKLASSNAANLTFFTAATDRYNGEIGGTSDKGGDVSCVSYRLDYRDPIDGPSGTFKTFVLNRMLLNPDVTFENLLGKTDLKSAFSSYDNKVNDKENFVCENVFQFTVTFHVEVSKTSGTPAQTQVINVPVVVGENKAGQVTKLLKIKGTGIEADVSSGAVTAAELKTGRVSAVEVAITVLSDLGADQLRNRGFGDAGSAEKFLAEHSYQYSKLIQIPTM